jgi:hypothetical protein
MEKLQLCLKTNHIPKIDMRKFDGKDPITWILQMEQFFDLHNVPHTQKVRIASLYLEPNQFVWYRWLCSHKSLVTWTIFTEEMIAHYEDTRRNTFFSQLINLKKKGTMTYGLWYPKNQNFQLNSYSDADWEKCLDERKSTSGGAFFLGDSLVAWLSKKQGSISLSTTEAKYIVYAT